MGVKKEDIFEKDVFLGRPHKKNPFLEGPLSRGWGDKRPLRKELFFIEKRAKKSRNFFKNRKKNIIEEKNLVATSKELGKTT